MRVYKLTNPDYMTHNNTLWGENVTHETSGIGDLCSAGWLHYYYHPILANLLNPIHAQIRQPILWEAEAEGRHRDDHGLKGGCTKLTTIKQIPLPQISLEERVEFAIRCARTLHCSDAWISWSDKWLSGEERNMDILYMLSIWDNNYFHLLNSACYRASLAARSWKSSTLASGEEHKSAREGCINDCIYESASSIQLAVDLSITKVDSLNLNDIIPLVFPNYGE